MTKYEEKAIEAFKLMWKSWGSFSTISLQDSTIVLADECSGFGSGANEYWKDKAAFLKYCEASPSSNPEGFKSEFKWIATNHLSEKIVGLSGEISIIMELPEKIITIDPLRITGVFKVIGDEVKLVQWHISRPDASMEEEIWEGTGAPKYYENVSVMFTDFVGFTKQASKISPRKLVDELNEIFARFDLITKRNGLEKIKTIGDAYMAVKGLKDESDHANAVVNASKEMLQYLHARNNQKEISWEMRIGIHSGSVIGGTIGSEKIGFDLWGDTVNIASRMESASDVNRINISKATYELIRNDFDCEYRGLIEVKGERKIEMYFIS